jgi:hypothetical protein
LAPGSLQEPVIDTDTNVNPEEYQRGKLGIPETIMAFIINYLPVSGSQAAWILPLTWYIDARVLIKEVAT